ncbi:MAG TPA: hypothetical protein PKE64_26815 [Anaerolineae bacterium]|nr:hypothetical protein [Anaerolineae bacterium]HMR67639.1 hypothetical protein [Anaerolineae bacterium]
MPCVKFPVDEKCRARELPLPPRGSPELPRQMITIEIEVISEEKAGVVPGYQPYAHQDSQVD